MRDHWTRAIEAASIECVTHGELQASWVMRGIGDALADDYQADDARDDINSYAEHYRAGFEMVSIHPTTRAVFTVGRG